MLLYVQLNSLTGEFRLLAKTSFILPAMITNKNGCPNSKLLALCPFLNVCNVKVFLSSNIP